MMLYNSLSLHGEKIVIILLSLLRKFQWINNSVEWLVIEVFIYLKFIGSLPIIVSESMQNPPHQLNKIK